VNPRRNVCTEGRSNVLTLNGSPPLMGGHKPGAPERGFLSPDRVNEAAGHRPDVDCVHEALYARNRNLSVLDTREFVRAPRLGRATFLSHCARINATYSGLLC
jgi:hypothetical protein